MDQLPQELGEVLEKAQLLLVAAMIFASDSTYPDQRTPECAEIAFDEAETFLKVAKRRGADLMSIAQTMNEEGTDAGN